MSTPDHAELNRPAGERPGRDLGPDVATETQALFLGRLKRLLERRHGAGGSKLAPEQRLMLDRAIYSTFCDCLELDVSSQARLLLKEAQAS